MAPPQDERAQATGPPNRAMLDFDRKDRGAGAARGWHSEVP